MAAQYASGVGVAQDGYRSEDEDSTVEFRLDQFPNFQDPVVTIQKDPLLEADSWTSRDSRDWEYYIPTWTCPGYDDKTEVKGDGTEERPRRGDPWKMMRPALLPTDPPASQYAKQVSESGRAEKLLLMIIFRRFGIFPDQYLTENSQARSMLTPVPGSISDPRLDDGGIEWSVEQSFQAFCWNSFTSKEVRNP